MLATQHFRRTPPRSSRLHRDFDVWCLGLRVWGSGLGFRVSGLGFGVWGLGFGV